MPSVKNIGKPYAGKPHVRFDEGGQARACFLLYLDKSIARQSDSVAFFKVENDGFGLGAQRRANAGEQLTQVQAELAEYLQALRSHQPTDNLHPMLGLIVPKEKIAANGDYNLSGERYREGAAKTHIFPLVRIGDVCTVNPRKNQLNDLDPNTCISFVPMADLNEHRIAFQPNEEKRLSEVSASYTYFEDNDVLLAKVTPCFENGKAGIAHGLRNGIGFGSSEFYVLRSSEQVLPEWIYFCVMHPLFRDAAVAQMTGTGGLQRVPRDYVENFKIPLPPLEVQKEIVAEIEGYQKVIDGARAVLDNYRPHIPIHPDWPDMALGEVCRFIDYRGKTPEKTTSGLPLITAKNVREGFINPEPREFIAEADYDAWMTRGIPQVGDVLFTMEAPLGNVAEITMTGRFALAQRLVALCPNRELLVGAFLKDLLLTQTLQEKILAHQSGTTVYGIKASVLKGLTIPVPPLATQQAIVAEIEAEQALVAANRELIARFEKKIQATLARVWGEETPAILQSTADDNLVDMATEDEVA